MTRSENDRMMTTIIHNKYVTLDTKLGKDWTMTRSEDGRVMTTIHNNYVTVDSKLAWDWQCDDHYTLRLRYGC